MMLTIGILIGMYVGIGISACILAVYAYKTETDEFRGDYSKEIGIKKSILIIFVIWPLVIYQALKDMDN